MTQTKIIGKLGLKTSYNAGQAIRATDLQKLSRAIEYLETDGMEVTIQPNGGIKLKANTASETSHPWKVIVANVSGTYKLRVAPGYRYATGAAPVRVPTAGSDPDYTEISSGAQVYLVYTLPVWNGSSFTAGSWGSLTSGTAPAETATTRVRVIADINTSGTVPVVSMQRIRGDIEVFDPVTLYGIAGLYYYLGIKSDGSFGPDRVRGHE